ncbi:MAG TPA: tripartite tricarboxylate transporter TctB family protein [Burkholderiaceae bacterium]|nr:tripartite tricarboxylate transporter TctB family protein [Burkholderiaceae bacterium]
MQQPKRNLGKDHLGALLLLALGAGVFALGLGYRMGNLNRMGAGFIPVVLGVLMMAVGVAIGVTAAPPGRREMVNPLPGHGAHASAVDWRGWGCILGGVAGFVVLGEHGGLLPATFASVFVSAMGDRTATWKGSALLAAGATLFCLVVFHYGLNLQLPLFQWV